jgi:hypothetical protein
MARYFAKRIQNKIGSFLVLPVTHKRSSLSKAFAIVYRI